MALNPNQFGANVAMAQPTQGVLPSGNTSSTSASSDENNGVVAVQNFSGGGAVDPGTIDDQDSGDAQAASVDPFGLVQDALTYGRSQFGLPDTLVAGRMPTIPAGPGGDQPGNPANQPFGSNPPLQPGQVPFGQRVSQDDTQPASYNDAQLADGGEIDEDMGTPNDGAAGPSQGVIPDETDQSGSDTSQQAQGGQQSNPQAIQAYLSGKGAVSPEIATALEQQVDPSGIMDPNARKMMAIKATGSPEKAFGLMQHYRQKFNAYSAFARAAAQGAGGRPPNPMESAKAATLAYQNLPDGKSVGVTPVQGGMRISVKDAMPRPAGKGAAKKFADGGEVDDDTPVIPQDNTGGGGGWGGDTQDQGQDTGEIAASDYNSAPDNSGANQDHPFPGGKAPHEMLRDFVLSIPQYVKWLTSDGQADAVLDKGVESTLKDASHGTPQQGGAMPNSMPTGQDQPGTNPQMQAANGAQPDQAWNPNLWNQPQGNAQALTQPNATEAAQNKMSDVVQQAAENGSMKDVLHEIDQAYWSVGQSKERALARAAAIQEWNKNQTSVRRADIMAKGMGARAETTANSREAVAGINAAGRLNTAQFVEGQKNNRAMQSIGARLQMAKQNNDAAAYRAGLGVMRTMVGSQLGNMAAPEDVQAGTDAMLQHFGINVGGGQPQQPRQQAAPQSAGGTQPSQTDISYLQAHPDMAQKFDAKFGAGASTRWLGR